MSDDSSLDDYERDYWEAVARAAHPQPLRPPVKGASTPLHGEEAALRASQRSLRIFDGECANLNFARREAVLDTFLEQGARLNPLHYSEAYRRTFDVELKLALSALRIAGAAYASRYREAEAMRQRGRAEMERYEKEARRLEGYAEKHRTLRLADARFTR